ncbi:MAG: DUF4127 family protein [Spirosomataceae bacterium]
MDYFLMRISLCLIAIDLVVRSIAYSQSSSKVLLIPLDDRPPCLQFPVKMGPIGDVTLVSPPRELLGRFTDFGKSNQIISWLQQQDVVSFDAAIISMDMLAYGGLVASRVHATSQEQAIQWVEIIRILRKTAPKLKIYGSSVIMRLAPTADGKNEVYREKLSKWAELSPYKNNKTLTAQLEAEIPVEALINYKQARKRNLALNHLAIELTQESVFDYLILSQDDAKPKGVHIQERESLIAQVNQLGLADKIAIQPGADEVSMLLLARTVSDKYHYHPTIQAIFPSEELSNKVMPFEDKPLYQTVSLHLKAVGASEVQDSKDADIVFFVFNGRKQAGLSESFAQNIIDFHQKHPSKGIIIADIDPIGDVQGGDITFTNLLMHAGIFSKIFGYASWNTAGNVIGTALPHGILYGVSKTIQKTKIQAARMTKAQNWFMQNRLLDDFAYHSIVRPKANALSKEKGWNSFRLTDKQTAFIENFCLKELLHYAKAQRFGITHLRFDLPWNRTFEAEIDFDLY